MHFINNFPVDLEKQLPPNPRNVFIGLSLDPRHFRQMTVFPVFFSVPFIRFFIPIAVFVAILTIAIFFPIFLVIILILPA